MPVSDPRLDWLGCGTEERVAVVAVLRGAVARVALSAVVMAGMAGGEWWVQGRTCNRGRGEYGDVGECTS